MANKKILVVDDEVNIGEVIQDNLEDNGYDVELAITGKAGLEAARHSNPDLIILDVGLPDLDGYDVCRQLRQIATLRYTPIIMLTAHTRDTDEINSFKAGADDYVTKPFKPHRLLARIESAIGRNTRELNANALTHLPGNMAITQEIESRLKSNKEFSTLYFDLNNFKAFNDYYGFVRGDSVIKMTADIIGQVLTHASKLPSFFGHVGGDDFVAIVDSYEVETLCQEIINRFDKLIVELYDEKDRKAGKITTKDRKGDTVDFPIIGLAIAVITNRQKKFSHPGEIALIAGELKKLVKSNSRSSFLIDRRA